MSKDFFEHFDRVEGGLLYSWTWYGTDGTAISQATFIPDKEQSNE